MTGEGGRTLIIDNMPADTEPGLDRAAEDADEA